MTTGHFSLKDFGFVQMKDFPESRDDAKQCKKYKLLICLSATSFIRC